jgi:hypothetical protein
VVVGGASAETGVGAGAAEVAAGAVSLAFAVSEFDLEQATQVRRHKRQTKKIRRAVMLCSL